MAPGSRKWRPAKLGWTLLAIGIAVMVIVGVVPLAGRWIEGTNRPATISPIRHAPLAGAL